VRFQPAICLPLFPVLLCHHCTIGDCQCTDTSKTDMPNSMASWMFPSGSQTHRLSPLHITISSGLQAPTACAVEASGKRHSPLVDGPAPIPLRISGCTLAFSCTKVHVMAWLLSAGICGRADRCALSWYRAMGRVEVHLRCSACWLRLWCTGPSCIGCPGVGACHSSTHNRE
jgi:hypothetical protein